MAEITQTKNTVAAYGMYGTTDGGTTWYPIATDVSGNVASSVGGSAVSLTNPVFVQEIKQPKYEDDTVGVAVVEERYHYTHITTATTTVIDSTNGFHHTVVVNTPVLSGVIKMYDNTAASGNVIGTITYPATLLSSGPSSNTYDVLVNTGLTIVTTGVMDITVSSR